LDGSNAADRLETQGSGLLQSSAGQISPQQRGAAWIAKRSRSTSGFEQSAIRLDIQDNGRDSSRIQRLSRLSAISESLACASEVEQIWDFLEVSSSPGNGTP
jgi:hypothetical protein